MRLSSNVPLKNNRAACRSEAGAVLRNRPEVANRSPQSLIRSECLVTVTDDSRTKRGLKLEFGRRDVQNTGASRSRDDKEN